MKRYLTKKMMRLKIDIRGQSVAELALVLPIFLMIVMGIIEFGFLMSDYVTVVNGAREGARYATIGGTDSEIFQKVIDASPNLQSSGISVNIVPDEYNRKSGEDVTVTVEYEANAIMPVFEGILPSIYDVKSSVTMRVE